MSKLEQLISELCPDGVEYMFLKDIAEISTGSSNRVDANENGSYPFYVRSKHIQKSDKFLFDEEAIIIPGEGGVGDIFHYVNGRYDLHQRAYRIKVKDGYAITKFIYHYLKNDFKSFILMKAVNATVMSIRKPMIEKFSIPLPPLPIQEEIVRILDKFTLLEAELEAELEARQNQYEYYRDDLLDFGNKVSQVKLKNVAKLSKLEQLKSELCPNGVEYKSLEKIFNIRNGYTPSKANPDFWNNGTVPWFRMEDLRKNGGILSDSIQYITQEAVKGKLFPANSIIMATSATIGEHALLTVDALANQRFTFLTIKANYIKDINPKFAYYFCFILGKWCRENTNVSSFPSVDMRKFRKFKIPLPPLPIQEEIVRILDRFDALANDISKGLPAEIEARRKQYEYYRNKLLTFKEKE